MTRVYLQEYIEDRKLRASLDVMTWATVFKSRKRETIPFALIFIRLADRILHHSSNVWLNFISDLNVPPEALKQIPDNAFINTTDVVSKYEIEAYLGASKALFEPNVIGINVNGKQNLLGRSFAAYAEVCNHLKSIFVTKRNHFFPLANDIRNHSYHVNAQLKDIGLVALLKRVNGELVVTLPNIYDDGRGGSIDLAEVFVATHRFIEELIRDVRNVLLEFYFQQDGAPTHGSYTAVESPYGTMTVGLGPKGFEFSDLHEPKRSEQGSTASTGRG